MKMNNNFKVTKDGFVWLIIDRRKFAMHYLFFGNHFNLFVLHDNDAESLIVSHDDIEEALDKGLKIGVQVGSVKDIFPDYNNLLDACKTALEDTRMLLSGECDFTDENLQSTISVLENAINGEKSAKN